MTLLTFQEDRLSTEETCQKDGGAGGNGILP